MERQYVLEGDRPPYRSAEERPFVRNSAGKLATPVTVIRQVARLWVESIEDTSVLYGPFRAENRNSRPRERDTSANSQDSIARRHPGALR
jgi:hypothetical protein